MLLLIVVLLLIVALYGFGGYGGRYYSYGAPSLLGLLLVLAMVWLLLHVAGAV